MTKLLYTVLIVLLIVSCNQSPQQDKLVAQTVTAVVSPVDTASAEPYLYTDPSGTVYLSWIEKGKEQSALKYAKLIDGKWSTPAVITSGSNWFVNWADYPMLAADGAGNMIAHFLEKSEKGTYTYDVKLLGSTDSGSSWGVPRILNEDGKKAEHGFVSLVPYKGNFFVSWLDGRNAAMEGAGHGGHHGQMTLRGAVINTRGEKSGEWELDGRVCDCCQTSATITSSGPVVVYRDRSADEIRDISIVRMVNGQWTAPKPIFADNWKIAGCPVNGPRIDALESHLAVAWFTSPTEGKGQVSVVFSHDGGASFGTPIRLEEGKAIGRVDILMIDDKTAMVSWMEGSTIKAARIHANGTKEPSITIASSSEARSSGFPQMTKSGTQLIFAWTDAKDKTIKLASISHK